MLMRFLVFRGVVLLAEIRLEVNLWMLTLPLYHRCRTGMCRIYKKGQMQWMILWSLEIEL